MSIGHGDSRKREREPDPPHTFRCEGFLGKGTFGTVYKATVVETGMVVAIKSVSARFAGREVVALQALRGSPHVVALLGMFTEGEGASSMYNLVLQYVPDTLQRIIKTHRHDGKCMEMTLTRHFTYQLLRGLTCLEKLGVVHRDIKPANLLIDEGDMLKVCDFGTAKLPGYREENHPYVCSRYYRAPELILGTLNCTYAVDVWSAGCVFAEMLIGQPLFAGKDGIDQLQQIVEILGSPSPAEISAMNPEYGPSVAFEPIGPLPWDKVFDHWVPPCAQALVGRILRYDPIVRPKAETTMGFSFFDCLRREAGAARDGRREAGAPDAPQGTNKRDEHG